MVYGDLLGPFGLMYWRCTGSRGGWPPPPEMLSIRETAHPDPVVAESLKICRWGSRSLLVLEGLTTREPFDFLR